MKAFLDTNIYISHYRDGRHEDLLHRLNAEYILYLHAVVLAELHAGVRTEAFLRELVRLEKMFVVQDRIVIPQVRDYRFAGQMIRRAKNKIFLPDALLASSARQEGIFLVTEDRDFERIKHVQPFPLLLVQPQVH